MAYFKNLDKIDKIVISFTFILVTFLCILNNFSLAVEEDYTLIQPNRYIDNLTFSSNVDYLFLYSNTATNLYDISKTQYLIINGDTKNIQFCFIKEEPGSNVLIYDYTNVLVNETVEIDLTEKDYKYMLITNVNGDFNDYNVYVSNQSLTYVIDNLSKNVGITNLWTNFENIIPYILVVVIFSLGVWFIKHNIIEHSKGRDF